MQVYALVVQMWLAVALTTLVAAPAHAATTTEKIRYCGRSLSQAVSLVCRSFNSPSWDEGGMPARNRVKRDYGIADECCAAGCTWDELRLYCADDEPSFPSPELAREESDEMGHMIADRSVEAAAPEAPPAAAVAAAGFRGLFGRSEMRQRGALRSAPIVGTVSPLLAWGRTLHTVLPPRDRLLYVTV